MALVVVSCGGGSGGPTVKQGQFIDSAVEGLRYVSGSQSGTTDANGTFSFEVGQSIRFFIGDILLGEVEADTVITPVKLVAGATDETNPTVTNIVRFLQSIDDDHDPENGIRISEAIRILANGRTIQFSSSEAEFENDLAVLGFLSEISGAPGLPSIFQARAHLRGTLIKSLVATYSGKFSGSNSGLGIFDLTCRGAYWFSNSYRFFRGCCFSWGKRIKQWIILDTASGSISGGGRFVGTISRSGVVTGTWENVGDRGTFRGNKQ